MLRILLCDVRRYEFLLHEASTKMYRRLKIAVDDSPLPRTNPDWIRLNEMVRDHDVHLYEKCI